MKRFVQKTLVFALPVILLAIFFELLLRNIPNDYSYKKDYLDRHSRSISVLFLGNSHMYYGIDPRYLSSNSFNAAGVSQSLDVDLAILKKYESKWDNLKFIVLPMDYLSLYSTLECGLESWRVKNYSIYYDIHLTSNIPDNTELFTNPLITNLLRLYSNYYKHNTIIYCSSLGWGTRHQGNPQENLDIKGREAAKRHTEKSNSLVNRNLGIVKSLIEFARSKKIHVLFFTSPAYSSYSENLDKNQLNNTIHLADSVVHLYSNASYVNLLNNKDFKPADFFDGDHLNEIGAKKLTLKISGLLKEIN